MKSNHQEQAQHQPDNDNDDFEELMNFRRQKFNRGGPQHLPCVEEDKGISDSLASLMADGFEFEWLAIISKFSLIDWLVD